MSSVIAGACVTPVCPDRLNTFLLLNDFSVVDKKEDSLLFRFEQMFLSATLGAMNSADCRLLFIDDLVVLVKGIETRFR